MERKKNIVSASINADGHVIVGDGNSIVNLKEAAQYIVLEKDLAALADRMQKTHTRIEKYPDEEEFRIELLQISEAYNNTQKQINALKAEVLKLANDFSKIPINTKRLKLAKEYFEAGDFDKARAILNAENMSTELG